MQWKHACADTRGRKDFPPVDVERLFQRFDDALDERRQVGFVQEGIQQQEELVAADACERIAGTNVVRHALRDCDQQRIPGRVAVVVVYLLEVVHVDERERKHAAAPVLPQSGVDELRHERAIR